MRIRELLEAKSITKTPSVKPRNFVAKNAPTSGAGKHKDSSKKKDMEQGKVKHKKDLMPMESKQGVAETATAGATSAGNVAVGPVYTNKKGKTYKNKDGTVKNALDVKGANLMTGSSIKR
jgi:hypothetical protein